MLVRTIAAAIPLVLGAGEKTTTEPGGSTEEQGRRSEMGDSVPGHGHAAGALGNSSDTTGAKGEGGVGSNAGTAGAQGEAAAGEKGDTTSGAPSGRWDQSGGSASAPSSPGETRAGGHERDRTMTGTVSEVSDESVTIRSPAGERHTLRIVPQTRFTVGGEAAQRTQLAEGQEVRASYAEHGGDRVAVRIDASAGGGKGAGEKGATEGGAKR